MAEEHPELAVTFLKGMIKVGRWANEHKRAAALDRASSLPPDAATLDENQREAGWLDLDDLLHPRLAQLNRHAGIGVAQTVLAFEIGGARQDLVLVPQDRLDHLGHRQPGGVVGRPGLEQRDDLAAALAGALDDGVDAALRQQLGDRDPGHGREPRQRHHAVAVPAEHERRDILDRNVEFVGDVGDQSL